MANRGEQRRPSTAGGSKPHGLQTTRKSEHYFFSNYQLTNSAVASRSNIPAYTRPSKPTITRSYSTVKSEYQDSMSQGIKPKLSTTELKSNPSKRVHGSGKKLFDGIPPSLAYKVSKRERLLASQSPVGPEHRWNWDKPPKTRVPETGLARTSDEATRRAKFNANHPNSMDSIIRHWRERMAVSRSQEPVHYHRKNLFSRQRFIDGTADIKQIIHDYPYDSTGLTPNLIDPANVKPL